jgi:hypothetical protein
MEWDGKAQLRITPWPDRSVRLPLIVRRPMDLDATRTVLLPSFSNGIPIDDEETIELTGETYLELEQVELDDPSSILGFVRRYGPLGGWAAYHDLQQAAMNRANDPLFFLLYHEQLNADDLWKRKERALRDQMMELPEWIPAAERRKWRKTTTSRLLGDLPPVVETLDEFRFAARLLVDLKTAWLVVREGRSPSSAEWLSDPIRERPMDARDRLLTHLGEARAGAILGSRIAEPSRFLSDMLERLLRSFSPKLGLEVHYFPPTFDVNVLFQPPTEVVVMPRREAARVPLYAICALELFNHILDNAQYHTCENERCGRTFVYQQGRSEKGQRRSSGVLYCTPACARATAQREYRRRKRRTG